MSEQFAFITLDKLGKPHSVDRRLIRSHCMQGKNRHEGLRRSAKQVPGTSVLSHQPCLTQIGPSVGGDHTIREDQSYSPSEIIIPKDGNVVVTTKLPRPPPPDVGLIPFAECLDMHSQKLLYQCK